MEWFERIKEIKSGKKISNDELAAKSGIPLGTLNKALARQTGSPKLSMLESIASALEVSVAYLIGEDSAGDAKLNDLFSSLDSEGKEAVMHELDKQIILTKQRAEKRATAELEPVNTRDILIYDIPVSAGPGSFLDSDHSSIVSVAVNDVTDRADYAVRVSGNSMEPRYYDGDVVIVESCGEIPQGKIGIFVYNGESYIKKYGGDRLISVNREYKDIVFGKEDEIRCLGQVLGRLKFTK